MQAGLSLQSLSRLVLRMSGLAFGVMALPAAEAQADHLQIAGQWTCTVNARSQDPDGNYGLELAVQIRQNNSLYARGIVIYPNLANNIQKVEGPGDWSSSPSVNNKGEVIKFRMHPRTHPIITWFANPAGQGRLYNFISFTSNTGAATTVETQCSRSR